MATPSATELPPPPPLTDMSGFQPLEPLVADELESLFKEFSNDSPVIARRDIQHRLPEDDSTQRALLEFLACDSQGNISFDGFQRAFEASPAAMRLLFDASPSGPPSDFEPDPQVIFSRHSQDGRITEEYMRSILNAHMGTDGTDIDSLCEAMMEMMDPDRRGYVDETGFVNAFDTEPQIALVFKSLPASRMGSPSEMKGTTVRAPPKLRTYHSIRSIQSLTIRACRCPPLEGVMCKSWVYVLGCFDLGVYTRVYCFPISAYTHKMTYFCRSCGGSLPTQI